jgi:D-arabinose 1-dehydrogenase-like Zn-dependent alcohol dehydrogenase
MAKMKAVQVPKPGADFEVVEGDSPLRGAGQVRIRVQACGVCHSDVLTEEGVSLVGGLGPSGTLLVVGAGTDPIEVQPGDLIFGRKRIQGWSAGLPTDSEDTLRFAEMSGVRPMIEKYPFLKAADADGRMMSGKAEFRVVLTM